MNRYAAFACALTLTACGRGSSPATPAEKPAPSGPPTIDVVQIVEEPLDVTLDMPGELEAFETVAIIPRVTGFVKTIRVDRGSHVRAGQLLVELDAPELVAQRAEAYSKLQGADAQLAAVRSKAGADSSTYEKLKAASATPGVVAGNDLVIAQKAVEADQNQIASAQQNVEAARQALNAISQLEGYLKVTAPFDGVVIERSVHPGALVGPSSGSPMLRVVDQRRLRLTVPVPEAYIAGVSEGVAMPFTVPAYPGQTFSGTLARISHNVDVKTRTMAIELDVVNRDGRLAPGTFCQVRWPVRRSGPSLLAPSGSIASTTGRTFVVRIRNGRTEWVDVTTGLTAGPLIEVFGDLNAGDDIAARGTDELRPGTQVRLKPIADVKPPAMLERQPRAASASVRLTTERRAIPGTGSDGGGRRDPSAPAAPRASRAPR
jgi:membrane fusion protein, multidrug efflux system